MGGKTLFGKKIIIVGHVTKSYGPMQALPKYLAKNVREFAVISHPFSYSEISNSVCICYEDGEEVMRMEGPQYKTADLVHFIGDVLLTFYFIIKLRIRWDIFIGSDCLNAFSGILLRNLRVVKEVIFYEHDYISERFENKLFNTIFHFFNCFAARRSDVVWDSPPNLKKVRKGQGVDLKKVLRVPYGIDLEKIEVPPLDKINRYTLVYAGHVTQSKGLQLVVEALGELVVTSVPNVKVSIVGSGPYEGALKELVKKIGLEKHFKFFGYTDHDWTLSYLPTCGVALAPYVSGRRGDFLAEPLKVIDYLGCGLPVIITWAPNIAKEIEAKRLGAVVNYKKKELGEAIIKLLTDDGFYEDCRENVLAYAANITWDYTYDKAFEKTLELIKSTHGSGSSY